MQTKNVYFAERPDNVIVTTNGKNALIEFPVNVSEVETEDGTQYLAETVYSVRTFAVEGLKERVEANVEKWLERAKGVEPKTTSLDDVVEAINALTDLILGEE